MLVRRFFKFQNKVRCYKDNNDLDSLKVSVKEN